jgi:hypothetical protein
MSLIAGGVRCLCSIEFSNVSGLEGETCGDPAETIEPRPKVVSLSSGESIARFKFWRVLPLGIEEFGSLSNLSVTCESSCCGDILPRPSASGSCLMPAPNGCKGWTIF